MREYHTLCIIQISRRAAVTLKASSTSESFRYVNMTTLLSRTASCHNASLLQYSPGNDLQVDPATDYLEGTLQRATILLVPRLTHCHRLCACVVDHNFLS